LGEGQGDIQVAFAVQTSDISETSLGPKLLQGVYRNVYCLSVGDKSGDLGWTLAYFFRGGKIFDTLYVRA